MLFVESVSATLVTRIHIHLIFLWLIFPPSYPIDPNSPEYSQQRKLIEQAVAVHQASLTPVPNQMVAGSSPDRMVCCDPQSQKKYVGGLLCLCIMPLLLLL